MNIQAALLIVGLVLLFAASAFGVPRPERFEIQWSPRRPATLFDVIRTKSATEGILSEHLAAILYIESRGNPNAVNPSDPSYGIAQMQTATASGLAGEPVSASRLLQDWQFAVQLAARFIAILQRRYAARMPFAEWAQAYNVGETRFDKGIRNPKYGANVEAPDGKTVFLNPGQLADFFRVYGLEG